MWVTFFGILFLTLSVLSLINDNGNYENKVNVNVISKDYATMQSYEYTYDIEYTLDGKLEKISISGTKYDNKNSFKLNGNKYFIVGDNIYDIEDSIVSDLAPYDLINLEPTRIDTLLKSANDKVETKYKDGAKKTEYTFTDMFITTYENDGYLDKIELDLTKYMQNINNKITTYNIVINYTNINNIDSLN